jgi:hypothetical protein
VTQAALREKAEDTLLSLMEATEPCDVLCGILPSLAKHRSPRARLAFCNLVCRTATDFGPSEVPFRNSEFFAGLLSMAESDKSSAVRNAALTALTVGADPEALGDMDAVCSAMLECGGSDTLAARLRGGQAEEDEEDDGASSRPSGSIGSVDSPDGILERGTRSLGSTSGARSVASSAHEDGMDVIPLGAEQLTELHLTPGWKPGLIGFTMGGGLPPAKPKAFRSEDELRRAVHHATEVLAKVENDWSVRAKAMETVRELLAAGAASHPAWATAVLALAEPLKAQVVDLRSSIVRHACVLIAELSASMREAFEPIAVKVFPSLAKITITTIAVIARSGHDAALSVLHNTRKGFYRLLPKMIAASQSRSPVLRARAAEFLTVACRGWSRATLEKHHEELADAVATLLADADADARQIARLTFWSLVDMFPDHRDRMLGALDAGARKRVLSARPAAVEDAQASAAFAHVSPLAGEPVPRKPLASAALQPRKESKGHLPPIVATSKAPASGKPRVPRRGSSIMAGTEAEEEIRAVAARGGAKPKQYQTLPLPPRAKEHQPAARAASVSGSAVELPEEFKPSKSLHRSPARPPPAAPATEDEGASESFATDVAELAGAGPATPPRAAPPSAKKTKASPSLHDAELLKRTIDDLSSGDWRKVRDAATEVMQQAEEVLGDPSARPAIVLGASKVAPALASAALACKHERVTGDVLRALASLVSVPAASDAVSGDISHLVRPAVAALASRSSGPRAAGEEALASLQASVGEASLLSALSRVLSSPESGPDATQAGSILAGCLRALRVVLASEDSLVAMGGMQGVASSMAERMVRLAQFPPSAPHSGDIRAALPSAVSALHRVAPSALPAALSLMSDTEGRAIAASFETVIPGILETFDQQRRVGGTPERRTVAATPPEAPASERRTVAATPTPERRTVPSEPRVDPPALPDAPAALTPSAAETHASFTPFHEDRPKSARAIAKESIRQGIASSGVQRRHRSRLSDGATASSSKTSFSESELASLIGVVGAKGTTSRVRQASLVRIAKAAMTPDTEEVWERLMSRATASVVTAAVASMMDEAHEAPEAVAAALATTRRLIRYQPRALLGSGSSLGMLDALFRAVPSASGRRDMLHNLQQTIAELVGIADPDESLAVCIRVGHDTLPEGVGRRPDGSPTPAWTTPNPSAVQSLCMAFKTAALLVPVLSTTTMAHEMGGGPLEDTMLGLLSLSMSATEREVRKNATVVLSAALGRLGEEAFAVGIDPALSRAQRSLVRIFHRKQSSNVA